MAVHGPSWRMVSSPVACGVKAGALSSSSAMLGCKMEPVEGVLNRIAAQANLALLLLSSLTLWISAFVSIPCHHFLGVYSLLTLNSQLCIYMNTPCPFICHRCLCQRIT